MANRAAHELARRTGTTIRCCIVVLVALSSACITARAEDVVQRRAIRDTDCATLEITRGPDGIYIARGCGKAVAYACDRAVGQGTNFSSADNAGCKKVDVPK